MSRLHRRAKHSQSRQFDGNRGRRIVQARSVRVVLAAAALLAVFCLSVTWWTWHLLHMGLAPALEARVAAPRGIGEADALFGGGRDSQEKRAVRVTGVLALQNGAAAIVGEGDAPPKAMRRGAIIVPGVTLEEVRAHSIVIDRSGTRTEVLLPSVPPNRPDGSMIYVR